MFVCLSPGGQSLTQGETARRINCSLAPSTASSHFKSAAARGRATERWFPASTSARSSSSPRPRRCFGGTYSCEIYASTDLGKSWQRRDNGIGDKEIYSLASQVVDGKPRVYAGTEPAHLFYSDDLGKSWTELPGLRQVPGVEKLTFPGPPHLAHAKSITFHPKDPNIIYVAVEVGGFLRSTDGGKSGRPWITSIPTLTACWCRSMIRPNFMARRRQPTAVPTPWPVFASAATAAPVGRA